MVFESFWSRENRTFNRKFTLLQHPMSLGPSNMVLESFWPSENRTFNRKITLMQHPFRSQIRKVAHLSNIDTKSTQ